MTTVLIVVATRPDFIKLAPVIRRLDRAENVRSVVCFTAQHRDLVEPLIDFFNIVPDVDLDVMTAGQGLVDIHTRVLERITPVIARVQPDWVVVHGDTTSALAAAQAAFYQRVPIAHVEAGLRSGHASDPFPEEMNRRLITQLASLHFAPTRSAHAALKREGIADDRITVAGNTIVDALNWCRDQPFEPETSPLAALAFEPLPIVTVTAHRREAHGDGIVQICEAVRRLTEEHAVHVALPVHPSPAISDTVVRQLNGLPRVTLLPPLGYREFVWLLDRSRVVLTDSGGVQEEAVALGRPVVVMRNRTDRPEAVDLGMAEVVGLDRDAIAAAAGRALHSVGAIRPTRNPYGNGRASLRIVERLLKDAPVAPPDAAHRASVSLPGGTFGARTAGARTEISLPPRQVNAVYQRNLRRVLVVGDGAPDSGRMPAVAGELDAAGFEVAVLRLKTAAEAGTGTRRNATPLDGARAVVVVDLPVRIPAETTIADRVQIVADAVAREARQQRAALVVTGGDEVYGAGALLASRRSGVPCALDPRIDGPDHDFPVGTLQAEADGLVAGTPDGWIAAAGLRHQAAQSALEPSRLLRSVRLGIISDQFTFDTFAPDVDPLYLRPDSWRAQIRSGCPDAVLIESAWSGLDNVWRRVFLQSRHRFHVELHRLIETCRAAGIPVIFWNKEDPVSFDVFQSVASRADAIFTSDADVIPEYLALPFGRASVVASLPFAAQPLLHNPLPGLRPPDDAVCFAGTYRQRRYPERTAYQELLLDAALDTGELAIYDRHLESPSPERTFTDRFQASIRGQLTYAEVVDAYRAHPIHLNVNSVLDSPTMCARRVFEIAACGSAVISAPGRPVREFFEGEIPVLSDPVGARHLLQEWRANPSARLAATAPAYRRVFRSHLTGQSLAYVLRSIGLRVTAPELPRYAVITDLATPEIVARLAAQTVPPAVICAGALEAQSAMRVVPWSPGIGEQLMSDGIEWVGWVDVDLASSMESTWFEDLLLTRHFDDSIAVGYVARWPRLPERMVYPEVGVPATGSIVRLDRVALSLDPPADALRGLGVIRFAPGMDSREKAGVKWGAGRLSDQCEGLRNSRVLADWTRRKAAASDARRGLDILAGRLTLPGYPTVPIGAIPNWDGDPLESRNWQLNLHAFRPLEDLAAAYREHRDERVLDMAAAWVLDWIDRYLDEPPLQPVEMAWYDHAVPLRAENWACWMHEVLTIAPDWVSRNGHVFAAMLRACETHAWLLQRPAYYVSQSNHGADQSRVLLMLATQLSLEGPVAEWRRVAIDRLTRELDVAFTAEGVHVENSPGYHVFTCEIFAKVYESFPELHSTPFGEGWRAIAPGATAFLAHVLRPDGVLPLLGDSQALAPTLPITQAIPDEVRAAWESAQSFGASGLQTLPVNVVYPESGYAIFRNRWPSVRGGPGAIHVVVKAGALSMVHRHPDDLSLIVYAFGEDWLIDAGLCMYNPTQERRYAISREAHNAPFIAGAKLARANRREPHWRVTDSSVKPDRPFVTIETRVITGHVMRRTVELQGSDLWVHDHVERIDEGTSDLSLLWHIPDNRRIVADDASLLVTSTSTGNTMAVTWHSTAPLSLSSARDRDGDQIHAITSPRLHIIEPAQVIRFSAGEQRELDVSTRFRFGKAQR